jgi:hypothetical protein
MRTETLDVERIEVVALGRKVAALVPLRLPALELVERDADRRASA